MTGVDKEKVPGDRSEKTPATSFGNKGMIIGIIIVIAIIAFAIGIIVAGNGTVGSAMVSQDTCAVSVLTYMNSNLVTSGSTVTLVSMVEKDGMYQYTTSYQGRNITLYSSKDCTRLYTGAYDLKATLTTVPTASPTPTPAPAKSYRPTVELFVMAFCPYCVQEESAMVPVVDLLGDKINLTVRFVANVGGTTVDSISSLHGTEEAKEDLRQLCIMKMYPGKYWDYLSRFDTECYPVWQNATQLRACQDSVSAALGITGIDACASGSEGIAMLSANGVVSGNYGVTSTPTLFINGQKYSGQRTAEALRQAICDSFDTPPAECSVALPA